MSVAILVLRMLLAGVFGLAGVAKLVDLKRSRSSVADFGVPKWLADPLGTCLPFFELGVAGLLFSVRTTWWGALGSVVLLAVFAIAISFNLARGKRPDCNCFGQLHSEPIGASTLYRNGLLLLLALMVFFRSFHDPGLSYSKIYSSMLTMTGRDALFAFSSVVLLLATTVQSWLLLHLFRQNGRLLLRVESLEALGTKQPSPVQRGLKVGSPAPAFELALAKGGTTSLDFLRSLGKPILLVFSDSNCGPCKELSPELTRWERDFSEKLTIAVLTRGVTRENFERQPGLKFVLVQKDAEVAMRYQALGTPAAVLVDVDGTVASTLAAGALAIRELVSAAAAGRLPIPRTGQLPPSPKSKALNLGAPAPKFTLPDVTGKLVTLGDLRGRKSLLLFWNPNCGFCARMLERLRQLEREQNVAAPSIVLISTGTPEQNRAMNLSSMVLLDQGGGAMNLFGAVGTPSALMLDENANIASAVAVGADAVLELAKGAAANSVSSAPILTEIVKVVRN